MAVFDQINMGSTAEALQVRTQSAICLKLNVATHFSADFLNNLKSFRKESFLKLWKAQEIRKYTVAALDSWQQLLELQETNLRRVIDEKQVPLARGGCNLPVANLTCPDTNSKGHFSLEIMEIKCSAWMQEQKSRSDKATNQLLLAAERLKQDSSQLVQQNNVCLTSRYTVGLKLPLLMSISYVVNQNVHIDCLHLKLSLGQSVFLWFSEVRCSTGNKPA